jgi:autotransporter-associated beta strand protein
MRMAVLVGIATGVSAATRTWTGAVSPDWSNAGNWLEGSAPGNGDDLVFASGNPPNQPANNDIASLALRSIAFANDTFTEPLTLGGNAFTLDAAYGATTTLTNDNAKSGRTVTIGNDIALVGDQAWFAANANGVTLLTGDLSGSPTLTLTTAHMMQASGDGALPVWRFSGTNSGFSGQVRFGNQRMGLELRQPGAMVAGNISLGPGNVNPDRAFLYLSGSAASSPFTFGVGTGSGQVQFNSGSRTSGGLLHNGNQWLRLGGSGDYIWSPLTFHVEGRVSGSTGALVLGQAGEKLVLADSFDSGIKTFRVDGTATVDLRYALDDTGLSGRTLRKTSNGALILNAAASGAQTTAIGINGGALGVSSMDRLFDGNLDIGNNNGSGVLVLDGVSWSAFAADRSGGYGTGANQWRFSGTGSPGFGARRAALTIGASATMATTFDRNFTLGSPVRDANGELYADAPVILDRGAGEDTIALSDATSRTWTFVGGSTLANGMYSVAGPIHEIAGVIGGGASGRTLTLNGGADRAVGTIPALRLSNANNDFVANVATASSSPAGYGVLIATDDGVFGDSANTVTIYASTPGTSLAGNTGWMVLFEGSKEFARPLRFDMTTTAATGAKWGLGAYAGSVVYKGTATVLDTDNTTARNAVVNLHAEEGAILTLGVASGTPATFENNRFGSSVNHYRKTGPGTAILANVAFAGTATGIPAYDIQDGVLRETGSAGHNSVQGAHLRLAGGVLETRNALQPAGHFNRPLSTTVAAGNLDLSSTGGGWAAFGGPLTVDLNTAGTRDNLVWNTQSGLNGGTLLAFGSRTADNVVEFFDNLNLGASKSGTREFRVADNPAGAADRALLSGAISGIAGWTLAKTGDGTLVLAGANTHAGNTRVGAGLLAVDGSFDARTSTVTVEAGGALGGTGTIARDVTVQAGGTLAATDAASTTGLTIDGDATIDGFVGVRLPTPAVGTYTVATVNGALSLALPAAEPMPEELKLQGTVIVEGAGPYVIKVRVTSSGVATLLIVR